MTTARQDDAAPLTRLPDWWHTDAARVTRALERRRDGSGASYLLWDGALQLALVCEALAHGTARPGGVSEANLVARVLAGRVPRTQTVVLLPRSLLDGEPEALAAALMMCAHTLVGAINAPADDNPDVLRHRVASVVAGLVPLLTAWRERQSDQRSRRFHRRPGEVPRHPPA